MLGVFTWAFITFASFERFPHTAAALRTSVLGPPMITCVYARNYSEFHDTPCIDKTCKNYRSSNSIGDGCTSESRGGTACTHTEFFAATGLPKNSRVRPVAVWVRETAKKIEKRTE